MRWLRDESGQDMVEYALLVAVIGLFIAAAMGPRSGVVAAIIDICKRVAERFTA